MTDLERKKKHIMQTSKIGLYSQTGEVSFGDVQKIAHAVDVQFHQDVCPAWGLEPWSCTAHAAISDVPPDTIPLVILANADQAGALGYHDVGPDGRAYGKVFSDDTLKNGGTVLKGDNSVAVTVSHEGCEIVGDPKCNRWVLCSDGTMEASELSDRVESAGYDNIGTEATVSNFLYPAGFDPNAEPGAKRDHLGMTNRDGEILPGGYRIYLMPGQEHQQFAALASAVPLSGGTIREGANGSVHFRGGNGRHIVHFPALGLFVEFGRAYPEYRKTAKLAHISSRARRRLRALQRP